VRALRAGLTFFFVDFFLVEVFLPRVPMILSLH
jgi:hypothetical protein